MSATRQALYARLVDVLGVDHALTLMHYLPDDHPATRTDLGELRGEVRDLRSELREEIQGLRTELHAEMHGLRSELRTEIRALHDLFAGQTRTIVMTSFGSALTVATLVFVAAQIV